MAKFEGPILLFDIYKPKTQVHLQVETFMTALSWGFKFSLHDEKRMKSIFFKNVSGNFWTGAGHGFSDAQIKWAEKIMSQIDKWNKGK